MMKYDHDRMVASNRVYAELKVHDLENIIEYGSELWRYLMLLEYNNIKYKLLDFGISIDIITEYASVRFKSNGEQCYIKIERN